MNTIINAPVQLDTEFFSDLLITAFDGAYGSSWMWFESVGKDWLVTDGSDPVDSHWMSVHVRLKSEYRDDKNIRPLVAKRNDGWVLNHEAIAKGIERILQDDYVGTWRRATAGETAQILDKFGSATREGEIYGRAFRSGGTKLMGYYEVETGETARGIRRHLAQCLVEKDMDLDASEADAVVQVASFGKCIFG